MSNGFSVGYVGCNWFTMAGNDVKMFCLKLLLAGQSLVIGVFGHGFRNAFKMMF